MRVSLGGIPFWQTDHEGAVTFSHIDGIYGSGERITIHKTDKSGLLYCKLESNTTDGFLPLCHVIAARQKAIEIIGPDHFLSIKAERQWKAKQANANCVSWGDSILIKEGYAGWKIEFSPGGCEGITLWASKTIFIHWPDGEPDCGLMLHEIAHVVAGQENGHNSILAHEFMRLVNQYHVKMVNACTG